MTEIIDHHVDRGFYPWVKLGASAGVGVNDEKITTMTNQHHHHYMNTTGMQTARIIAFYDNAPVVMSTCTLIAEKFFSFSACGSSGSSNSDDDNDDGNGNDDDGEDNGSRGIHKINVKNMSPLLTEDVATLLLAVIAVDSSNLSTAMPRDMEAVTVC